MALDNPTPKHPSRTQTLQSFDIETHWQGACRGCHHHHYPQVINIHVSRERNIQNKDFYCEKCQKLLFCIGQSQTRLSLISLSTDPGEGGDPSQAPSSGRRACVYGPPDVYVNLGQRNQSRRSIDGSGNQSARGEDRSSFDSDQVSLSEHHTENSEDTTHSTTANETGQETVMQSLPTTSTPPNDRCTHGHRRGFVRKLVNRMQRSWQKFFKRSKPSQPAVYSNKATPPRRNPSTNSDNSLSEPAAQDNSTQQGSTVVPVSGSEHQPLLTNDLNGPNKDQTHVIQDGDHTDVNDAAELEKISKMRQEKTEIAKSKVVICRCESDCDCRNHNHGRLEIENPSEHSMQVHPSSSIQSVSDSNPESRPRDSIEFRYMGDWANNPQSTERQYESQSTHRQSMATVSSTTTAAMSHDALEPHEPPRAPSPQVTPPSLSVNTPSHSKSQLRLSTNLAPLSPVGETSSTSETSQTLRNAFDDRAVNQSHPSQPNEGPIDESSEEREFHQRESTEQNHPSNLPPDSSERNSSPKSSGDSGLPHTKRSNSE